MKKNRNRSRLSYVVTDPGAEARLVDRHISDFFEDRRKRGEEAKRTGRPQPPLIRTVDDLERMIRLGLMLHGDPLEGENDAGTSDRTKRCNKALKAGPEARKLLAELHRGKDRQ